MEEKTVTPKEEKKQNNNTINITKNIYVALAIVSIIGFLQIIIQSFIEIETTNYGEALLLLIIGIAFIIEANLKDLKKIPQGITPKRFTELVTLTIGTVALLAGIFSIPGIRYENPTFEAIKGILALIAIILIILQTWIVKTKKE